MRALLFVMCVLLGCLAATGSASVACHTETDLSFARLNNKDSRMHYLGLSSKYDSATGSVTIKGVSGAISRGVFEFRPSACVIDLKIDVTGSASIDTYERTSTKPKFNFEAVTGENQVVTPDLEHNTSGCGTHTLKITVPAGSSVTVRSISYCPDVDQQTALVRPGSRRARTVDDEVEDDESVHVTADEPIVPHPFCNSKLTNDGKHDYCYAVFSYSSLNNYTVSINSNNSYYFGAQVVNQNPTSYFSGGRDSDLSAFWICDKHITPVLGLMINTAMNNATSVHPTQSHYAVIGRGFTRPCPAELLEWFEASEVPEMFDD